MIFPFFAWALSPPENCELLLRSLLTPPPKMTVAELAGKIVRLGRTKIDPRFGPTLHSLNLLPTLPVDPSHAKPSFATLRKIWWGVNENPVATLKCLLEHDPDGTIGYCFGRSMAAHFEAMQLGVDETDIRKLFVDGDFHGVDQNFSENTWVYHATAIIRADDGLWYAIDPRLEGPVLAQVWVDYWRAFAVGSVAVQITEPRQLFPGGKKYSQLKVYKRSKHPRPSAEFRIHAYFRSLIQSYLESGKRLF